MDGNRTETTRSLLDVGNVSELVSLGGRGEVEIRNRTGGRYSTAELRQIVLAAGTGLSFTVRVTIIYSCKRGWLFQRGKRGKIHFYGFPFRKIRRIEIRIPGNRKYFSPPSQAWSYPGLPPELLRKGSLNLPEMKGIEIPLYVTAHELTHAAEPRATWTRRGKVTNESAAVRHGLVVLERFPRSGERFVENGNELGKFTSK